MAARAGSGAHTTRSTPASRVRCMGRMVLSLMSFDRGNITLTREGGGRSVRSAPVTPRVSRAGHRRVRQGGVRGGAVAELVHVVPPEAEHLARLVAGAGVVPAARVLDDAVEPGDRRVIHHQQRRVMSDLSPADRAMVVGNGAAKRITRLHGFGAGER